MDWTTRRISRVREMSTSITPRDTPSTLARETGPGTNHGNPPRPPKFLFLFFSLLPQNRSSTEKLEICGSVEIVSMNNLPCPFVWTSNTAVFEICVALKNYELYEVHNVIPGFLWFWNCFLSYFVEVLMSRCLNKIKCG